MSLSVSTSISAAVSSGFARRGEPVRAEQAGGGSDSKAGKGSAETITADQQREIAELKARDAEVRAHEAAHLAAAGGYARGGASFTYQRGPDGVLYAVGGEVQIDVAPVSQDPEANLRKAEIIKRAALAPANPSDQDRRVAAGAARMALEAQMELAQVARREAAASRYGAVAGGADGGGRIDQRA